MATAAILKFLSLKIMCTHVRPNFWKNSSNSEHHSKPMMNINSQHHNLTWKPNFAQIGGFLYLVTILYLGYHDSGRHFEFFQPPKAATHYGGYSYKVSWSLMKGFQFFLNPPYFVSMATAAKFVQPIPIFLAYLVPLDVDVVPIKFHQFLFGE